MNQQISRPAPLVNNQIPKKQETFKDVFEYRQVMGLQNYKSYKTIDSEEVHNIEEIDLKFKAKDYMRPKFSEILRVKGKTVKRLSKTTRSIIVFVKNFNFLFKF